MISEEQNPAAKRLKRYVEEQPTICHQTSSSNPEYISNKANHPILINNQHPELGANGTKKTGDTQDILAEACSVIGLGSSMLELVESPTKPDPTEHARANGHYAVPANATKRSDVQLVNGYRTYPQSYYHDNKAYTDGSYGYSNGYKEQMYPWNPNQSRKCFLPPTTEKMQQHYPYPRNQYEWHSLNNNQAQNPAFRSKAFANKPGVPVQQCHRLGYPQGMHGVAQNSIQPTYSGIAESKRYTQPYVNSYQRPSPGQVTSYMNSCRFPSPNSGMPGNVYPVPNSSVAQQGPHFHPNLNYTYANGQSSQQVHDATVSNKIPGYENYGKTDPSANMPAAYSPIRSPITPAPRIVQQNGIFCEKFAHFPTAQEEKTHYGLSSNKYISNEQKNQFKKSIPNEFYQPSPYKEELGHYNHVKPSIRRQSYSNSGNVNGTAKNCHNFTAVTPKHAVASYPPEYNTQLGYSHLENGYNYTSHNGLKVQTSADTTRSNGVESCSGYNTYKDNSRTPYQSAPMPKAIPIDYSLYGTDEIIKNSVRSPTPNLPHSPNIELIPLEGTSIISALSGVPHKSLPEISINSIRPAKEMELSNFKSNYPPANTTHAVSNNGVHNLENAHSYCLTNDNSCIVNQQDSNVLPNWYAKESTAYNEIPELTSIADVERMQQLEYSSLNSSNEFELETPLAEDPEMAGSNVVMAPLKIHKILNTNFVGAHSKYRPASEPLFQQRWPNVDDTKRPLSVPVNNIDHFFDSSLNLRPEDKARIHKFQQKLSPVLEHLLSIPEASGLLALKGSPKELLKHLVKLWGGETALSSSKIPLINIKENFLKLVKLLFKATHLLEWGWQNATADRILDDLVSPADGDDIEEYRVSLKVLNLISPPVQESSSDDGFGSIPVDDTSAFI